MLLMLPRAVASILVEENAKLQAEYEHIRKSNK
jgi:regulator of replication initiation timing